MTMPDGEPQVPPQGVPPVTPPADPGLPPAPAVVVDPEKEQLKKDLATTIEQKEHWKTKYERDISLPPINPPVSPDGFSDEGRAILEQHVAPLQQTVETLTDQLALERLTAQPEFAAIKELSAEFETYRKEYPRHKLENIAKLFLSEKGLLGTAPARPGLEPPTGGPRTPASTVMTAEEVKHIRETDWRRYQDMIKNGQIPPNLQ